MFNWRSSSFAGCFTLAFRPLNLKLPLAAFGRLVFTKISRIIPLDISHTVHSVILTHLIQSYPLKADLYVFCDYKGTSVVNFFKPKFIIHDSNPPDVFAWGKISSDVIDTAESDSTVSGDTVESEKYCALTSLEPMRKINT